MSLENKFFKKNFQYDAQRVENLIKIIKNSSSEKKKKAYKQLIFKMMKDIVKKNINNYVNLLKGLDVKNISERDEYFADCYVIFDKCIDKYIVDKGYNFYFYYNKSLSRNFFRNYQREALRNSNVEVTEALVIANSNFHDNRELLTLESIVDSLKLNDVENKIYHSKLMGQKTSEFLTENPDINNVQYSKSLKKIKDILLNFKKNNEL